MLMNVLIKVFLTQFLLYPGAEFQLKKGLIWSANVQGELKVNRNDQLIRGDLVSSGISSVLMMQKSLANYLRKLTLTLPEISKIIQ